ncbi:NlpC/P60 family protein [Streptomyces sp. BI20]|uniref:C40 family peptidase n=1 Tax=Streptomyces sp. BI20 TaxID=3403460 RepID=UPI003C73DDFC
MTDVRSDVRREARRDARPRGRGRALATAAVALAATAILLAPDALAAPAPPPTPAPSASPGASTPRALEEVRQEIERLYREAGSATDAYNLAVSETTEQSKQLVSVTKRVEEGRQRLATLKNRVGAAARAQYRSGGLPPEARLAMSGDPNHFLDSSARLRQGEQATAGALLELGRTQTDLEQYARDASAVWQRMEANRVTREKRKKEIEEKIKAAELLESRLSAEEKARLLRLEAEAQARAQAGWLNTGVLNGAVNSGEVGEGAREAIAYATAQLGKPYVWGAQGPDSFDCSGLTLQAWRAGGRAIPRTSQEQLRLPRVAPKDMRPGDLIVYFDDASHVALYIGDGKMIHSPKPGRTVTIAGAGSMPIKAIVRPDA